MTQAFYRKWRPQKWDEVVAQDHVVQTLRNAVRSDRIGHAYLLAGPRGTGKTTTARLLAKAINCLDPNPANRPCDVCGHCTAVNEGRFMDLVEIDAASNTSVEDVRDLREKINFRPSQGQSKVYIIDEVHMLSTAAFNALLKTLEEPPPHARFILATTEVHKIPPTILSRCQRYDFRRIPVDKIVDHLRAKALEEKLQVDEDALVLIARQATGAMRDAISLLDQLASTGQRVTLSEAQEVLGTATNSLVVELVESILSKDAARGLGTIQSALDAGTDARQYARQVVDYLRNLLLVRMGNAAQVDVTREMRAQMEQHARGFSQQRLLEAIRMFNSAAADERSAWHPGLGLELALAESVEEKEERDSAVPSRQESAAAKLPEAAAKLPEARQESAAAKLPEAAAKLPEADRPQPAAQGGRAITQHEVQQNWQRIKGLVKRRNPMCEGLLNSARSFHIKGDMLILGFQSEVVKSKMETPENIDILRQALQAALGSPLAVRCVVVGNKSGSASDMDIEGDGMVGAALDLGGKIISQE
jgi:DNA polymerase-3 subunit gamma/tau